MSNLSHKNTIKLIDKAFSVLEFLDDLKMAQRPLRDCFNLALAGEKQHRKGAPCPYHVNTHIAARMHVVRWIAHYTLDPANLPACSDMLDLRDDVVLAAMLSAKYRKEIRTALKKADIPLEQVDALDYVALVEGRDQTFEVAA